MAFSFGSASSFGSSFSAASFGSTSAASSAVAASAASTPAFAFGGATGGGFSGFGGFGATSTAATGAGAATSTSSASGSSSSSASVAPSGAFHFGSLTSAPAATTTTSSTPFAFGGATNASTTSGFAFGAPSTGTSSTFGSSAATATQATESAAAPQKPKLDKPAPITAFNATATNPAAPSAATTAAPSFGSFGGSAPAGGAKSLFAAAALAAPPASSAVAPPASVVSFAASTKPMPPVAFQRSSNSPSRVGSADSRALSVIGVADPTQSKEYFAANVKNHPLWTHMSTIGAFTLSPPVVSPPTDVPSGPGAVHKDSPSISHPFESRLAASFAGTLFCLAPPPIGAPSSNSARLFFADLKPLKSQHMQTAEQQAEAHRNGQIAFRELKCTPTPLPSHSHTIQLNSQATYAIVHSTNTVYLVCLASNKMEKAVMYDAATAPIEGVKVKTAAVGSWFHQNNSTLQILQVTFHPLSDIHLLILTNDSVLRVYNIKENLNLPIKEFNLQSVTQLSVPTGFGGTNAASRLGSRRGSAQWNTMGPASRANAPAHATRPMVTAFSFGSQPATRTAAASSDHNSWDLFSIYFLFSNGNISVLCPYLPPHVSLDRRLVLDLIACEKARLDELADAIESDGPINYDAEYEQTQARLVWLAQTFGHVSESAAEGNFVVSRDMGAHQLAQGWIQPAHGCGAHTAAQPTPASLAVPTPANSASGSTVYPYPASHLFAFRHAGIHPPGRFFRGFVDGRLDLLLRLVPVQPFFAVDSVRHLCEELDDLAGSQLTSMHSMASNGALDEMARMFASGGCYESYSIASLLVPADMAKIDRVEVPIVPPLPTVNSSGGLSRIGNMLSPGMSRGHSMAYDRSPSFSRAPSAPAGPSHTASPLQLFLPQFRPIIDLYDPAGLMFVTPHVIRAISYGDQLERVATLIASGEEDVLSAVQEIFADMHSAQKSLASLDLEEKTRKIVGCVLLNDPMLGKYMIHISSSTTGGPIVEVLELVRPQQRTINVKKILAASDAVIASTDGGISIRTDAAADATPLDSTLTPFATEIAPFLARLKNFQPPAGFPPGIAGDAGSLLNSPEALGEFLRIRKSYAATIQDLTLMRTLIRSRLTILGKFSQEQQEMFQEVEASIVACRANQAMLDDKIKLHQEMQKHLGDAVTGLSSDLTLHLSDLSPAEIAFHHNLLTLHSQSLPSFKHKLAELDRKGRHIQQIQAEMRQAAKSQARKGIATPDSKNAWSDKQIEAIKPIIANQSGRQTTAKAMRRTVGMADVIAMRVDTEEVAPPSPSSVPSPSTGFPPPSCVPSVASTTIASSASAPSASAAQPHTATTQMNNEQSEQHEDETTEAHETKEEAAKADTAQQPIEHATADESRGTSSPSPARLLPGLSLPTATGLIAAAAQPSSTEPAANSTSPMPTHNNDAINGTNDGVAGLTPLSSLSPEAAALDLDSVVPASSAPSASAPVSVAVSASVPPAAPAPTTTADLLNSVAAIDPSLDTIATLNSLNENLNQNLNVLNTTIANLTNMQHQTKAKANTPTPNNQDTHNHSPTPKSKPKKDSSHPDHSCQSMIECGELLPSGKRNMIAFVDFFGKEVEIYTATIDSQRRHLYRASALAEKFGYATNKVGMYLARRRSSASGIYQATSFRSKPPGRTGLKAGGYFLTMDACREFEHHFRQHDEMLALSSGPTMVSRSSHQTKREDRHDTDEQDEEAGQDAHNRDEDEESLEPDADVLDDDAAPLTRSSRSRPDKKSVKSSGRVRISSSEAEASANLALLAQFSPPPEPTPPTDLKKRSATDANLTNYTNSQRISDGSAPKRPNLVSGSSILARKSILPVVSVRKSDSVVVGSYHPGLSPLSPLSDDPSPTPAMGMSMGMGMAMPGLETEAGVQVPNSLPVTPNRPYTFEPTVKSETPNVNTNQQQLESALLATHTKVDLLAHQQAQQHFQYQQHLQSQQAHFQALANQHVTGRPIYQYATPASGYPSTGYPHPHTQPLPPFNPNPNTGFGQKLLSLPLASHAQPGTPMATGFMSPYMPSPMGGMATPMQTYSPFPTAMQINTPTQAGMMSPNGYTFQQQSMHGGAPMGLNIAYSVNMPNGGSNGVSSMPYGASMSPLTSGPALMHYTPGGMVSPFGLQSSPAGQIALPNFGLVSSPPPQPQPPQPNATINMPGTCITNGTMPTQPNLLHSATPSNAVSTGDQSSVAATTKLEPADHPPADPPNAIEAHTQPTAP